MFGFPVNLQDSGVQKFTNDADNGFPKIQQREVFYSVKDGIWTDRTIWQTASGRVGLLPTQFDDVYIRNDVQITGVAATYRINNLNISNRLSIRGNVGEVITIQVFNKLSGEGTLDIASISSTGYLSLLGNDHTIKTIVQNANSIIDYAGSNDQQLMDISYQNLYFSGRGIKTPKNNLVVNNQLRLQGTSQFIELSYFNLSVFGVTNVFGGNSLRKSHFGNVLFVGLLGVSTSPSTIDFSQGNPDVECRGGISTGVSNAGNEVRSGTGTWRFTTNNQSITSWNFPLVWDAPILIDNITLTLQGQAGADGGLSINAPINGTTGSSQLLMGATGVLNFNSLSSVSSMTTGIWNFTTNNNKIGYTGNYTATIPSYFTTFHNLTISGTGTKSLGVNTTLNGNLTLNGQFGSLLHGVLDCSIYNLSVSGITYFYNGALNKSGAGNLLFIGNFQSVSGYNINRINFSGNPNVEFRGGISRGNYDWNGGWNTGTGDWTFTTNNQTFQGPDGYIANSACRFIVSGNITITYTGGSAHNFENKINGTTTSSTWVNQGKMNFTGTEITPMATGVFDYLTSPNSNIAYLTAGSYNLPYTSYQSLQIEGTGTKSLIGNTTINGNFLMENNISRTLECSIYDLSILGTTKINGVISKNGAGNILFVGNVLFGGGTGVGNQGTFNFSGNPNVEFRGGITAGTYGSYQSFNSGTGQWKFSTNNQTYEFGSNFVTNNITCSILIDGAITLSIVNKSNFVLTNFNNSINGNNANSKLLVLSNAVINYNAATQPMITGILDTSTNLNTWIYGNGNQDIKGGPTTLAKQVYRNLTLNGGGTKTLQGYVSVQNTYTLTSPATLNNNGFTLTNP